MKQPAKNTLIAGVLVTVLTLLASATPVRAAEMQERIQTATQILGQKQRSAEPISDAIRKNAKGIAIFTVTKGGLGIGGLGGEGIVLLRINGLMWHSWTAPSAFNLGGASIGAQIGFTENRYIVILNTDEAVRQFTSRGKIDWNAMATGTAGSDTASEGATTADIDRRDVIVYKDTTGVFGGATLGGVSIERKDEINQKAYGNDVLTDNILSGKTPSPKSTKGLVDLLDEKV